MKTADARPLWSMDLQELQNVSGQSRLSVRQTVPLWQEDWKLQYPLIVAADHARFGLSEVKVELLATSGGLIRLPKLIPQKIAAEMCLSGKLISAQRAYEVGLVNLRGSGGPGNG